MPSEPKNLLVKASCQFCGQNPVSSHFLYWYFESSNIAFTPFRSFLLYNRLTRWIKKFSDRINLSWGLVKLCIWLGIIRFQEEAEACKVPRAKVLWQEAEKRGIKMRELLLLGRPFDVYVAESQKAKIKRQKLVFSGLPRPENYDDSALEWMDDKAILKDKFKKAGLPVPQGGSAWNFSQAKRIFQDIQPTRYTLYANSSFVIVKPRAGSRGRHSIIFVSSLKDLKEAFQIAKQLCFWVVVEEQLKGPVFRATLINFELRGVLRGDPPEVTGNGRNTLKELINIKNNQPHSGQKDIIIDESMEKFLAKQNLLLSSIPEQSQVVNLSEKIGVNYGGSSSEDFEVCHPDNKALFIKAAKVVGDPIIGFDFIIPDITRSWKDQKCGFIEANSLPFINLHHDPLLGKARNVAAAVWEMMSM